MTLDALFRRYRAVAVCFAVAAQVFANVAGRTHGTGFAVYLALGAVSTVIAVGLPMWATSRTAAVAQDAVDAAADARAEMLVTVRNVLTPIAHQLGRIGDARHAPALRELRGAAMTMVLAGTKELIGYSDVRAAYFRLRPGTPHRLVLEAYQGRSSPGTLELVEGDPLADYGMAVLASDEVAYFPDLRSDAPPGWGPDGHGYRSLIVAAVATERDYFGVLTVDSLTPYALREQDQETVRLMAKLLATALNR